MGEVDFTLIQRKENMELSVLFLSKISLLLKKRRKKACSLNDDLVVLTDATPSYS